MVDTSTCSDMFIEIVAPKDAENSKVPFDTKVMYDDKGVEYEVERFVFGTGLHGYGWGVECSLPPENIVYKRPLDSMYLEKPDSWSKLEEDLDECIEKDEVCCYCNKNKDCRSRPIFSNNPNGCISEVFKDVKERIRMLRGED